MKPIDRIDQHPTAIDQPLLRLRNVFQDRRSGKDRRIGVTYMDSALDRRIGERRQNHRRIKDRRAFLVDRASGSDRRKKDRRKKIGRFFR